MSIVRKTISSTTQRDHRASAQIAAGRFTNDNEYIRDLIRRDQESPAPFATHQAAIQEGLDSGTSDRTISQIIGEAEARFRQSGDL